MYVCIYTYVCIYNQCVVQCVEFLTACVLEADSMHYIRVLICTHGAYSELR
jgi:hypothetical protein